MMRFDSAEPLVFVELISSLKLDITIISSPSSSDRGDPKTCRHQCFTSIAAIPPTPPRFATKASIARRLGFRGLVPTTTAIAKPWMMLAPASSRVDHPGIPDADNSSHPVNLRYVEDILLGNQSPQKRGAGQAGFERVSTGQTRPFPRRTAKLAAKRRILEIVFLNCRLDDANLAPTMRKPSDVLAEGLFLKNSRADRI